MHRRVAILQSNYIPWKGYFDIIRQCDEFIIYDEVQYTRRDWRNRNRIKTADGLQWLTIPVDVKGKYTQRIDETTINDPAWSTQHWQRIRQSYARTKYFRELSPGFEELFNSLNVPLLTDVNERLIRAICQLTGIQTPIVRSTAYPTSTDDPTQRLLDICIQARATEYLSGPAAQDYLDTGRFEAAGVKVAWMDYRGYPEYPQLHPPFEHGVTMLDLLFNVGTDIQPYLERVSHAA